MVLLYLFYRLQISFKSHTHANQYGGADLTQLFATTPQKENTRTAKQILIHIWRHHHLLLLQPFSEHRHVHYEGCGEECGELSGQSFEQSAAGMCVRKHYYTCVGITTMCACM